jgi:hypothetical protein
LAYKYTYVDKISENKKSIHLCFGTAVHDTIQSYLFVLYNKKKLPQSININGINVRDYLIKEGKKIIDVDTTRLLKERMYDEVKKLSENERDDSITKDNMTEFYYDGIEIINYLKKKRNEWFTIQGWKLIDIEFELSENIKENLEFTGYIDILLEDKHGNYHIIDLKTSTSGWKDYHKKDKSLTNQNLLYKYYLSKKFNLPLDKIRVEYLVLKRKVPDDPEFAIMGRRLQRFIPTDGNVSVNRAVQDFMNFVDDVFDTEGQRKSDGYVPTPSMNSCRFCEYNKENICKFGMK